MRIHVPDVLRKSSPSNMALAALVVQEVRASGTVLVPDTVLEECIAPWLETIPWIETSALYGFGDVICVAIQTQGKYRRRRLVIDFKPASVEWEEGRHRLLFEFSVASTTAVNSAPDLVEGILAEAVGLVAPLLGLVASIAIQRVRLTLTASAVAKVGAEVDLDGVELEGGRVVVDLDRLPITKSLLRPVSKLPAEMAFLFRPELGLAEAVSVSCMSADRSGLRLHVSLSKGARKGWSVAADGMRRVVQAVKDRRGDRQG